MYSFFILLYAFLVRLAARFGNTKAKQLSAGQRGAWAQIDAKLQAGERRIWIHCASVGEFEQGRPLMEDLRDKFPQYKVPQGLQYLTDRKPVFEVRFYI